MYVLLQVVSLSLIKNTEELNSQKRKGDKLLSQMLPPTVARALRQHSPVTYFEYR